MQMELAPRAREFDEMGRPDKAIFRRLGEMGLLGIRYDPKYGGQGLDYSYHAVFLEELTLCDNSGVAMGVSVQTDMATPALARKMFITNTANADWLCLLAVTDPNAGDNGYTQVVVPTGTIGGGADEVMKEVVA